MNPLQTLFRMIINQNNKRTFGAKHILQLSIQIKWIHLYNLKDAKTHYCILSIFYLKIEWSVVTCGTESSITNTSFDFSTIYVLGMEGINANGMG